ncbi:MAG: hypothetical protein IPO83_02110 [Chitinophagaceae bacterium]|nr:hypothetical protein [Chitinophagaceae bacterium]
MEQVSDAMTSFNLEDDHYHFLLHFAYAILFFNATLHCVKSINEQADVRSIDLS